MAAARPAPPVLRAPPAPPPARRRPVVPLVRPWRAQGVAPGGQKSAVVRGPRGGRDRVAGIGSAKAAKVSTRSGSTRKASKTVAGESPLQLPRNTCSPARRADSVPNAKKHHPGTGTALRVVRSVVRHPLTPYDASVRSSGSHTKIENSVHRVRRRAPAKRPPNERRDALYRARMRPTLLLEGLRPGRVLGARYQAPEDDARNAHIWCTAVHQKFLPGGRIPFNGSLQGCVHFSFSVTAGIFPRRRQTQ